MFDITFLQALIPYSSPVVSTLSSLLDFFFLHWRWKQESEKLTIVLFDKFIDDSVSLVDFNGTNPRMI